MVRLQDIHQSLYWACIQGKGVQYVGKISSLACLMRQSFQQVRHTVSTGIIDRRLGKENVVNTHSTEFQYKREKNTNIGRTRNVILSFEMQGMEILPTHVFTDMIFKKKKKKAQITQKQRICYWLPKLWYGC